MALGRGSYGESAQRKVRAELATLHRAGVVTTGNACSTILLVKGAPGPAEQSDPQGGLLRGPDGNALRAALGALGYPPEDWAALACWDIHGKAIGADLFRLAVTTIDPATIVACDVAAAETLRNAYADDLAALQSLEEALFAEGHVVRVAGMRALNLGGFEAALTDSRQKQIMWARLKLIPPLGEPY